MKLKIFVNGKFVRFGGYDDLMVMQFENPNATVTAEKIQGCNYCVNRDF